MRDQGKLISGLVAGAGIMYLLDPDRGGRRRALVRDQAARATHKLGDGLDATARDLGNRAKGTAAGLRSRLRRETVEDTILHERVRSAIGRVVSHPSAIEVSVSEGRVTLQGSVLEHELDDLLRAVGRVRGVSEAVNELEVHREPGDVPSLQGGRPREPRAELAQENWAPGVRVLMGALGGILAYEGLRARGPVGVGMVAAGAGVLARTLTNLPARRLIGVGAGRRAVDVQKMIDVAAPIDEVWELWNSYENFPRFMAHLKEVRRTGEGRSHWVAAGPAGSKVEWDAVTTESVPNEVLAWKSVEGSAVENAGVVRFRPNPDGTTRIDVRMSYNPPGGAMGHAIAALFGADPKRAMDEDMVRLKSLLEEGKTRADEGPVSLDELTTSTPVRPKTTS
jgi:uncharacterized membrane protein